MTRAARHRDPRLLPQPAVWADPGDIVPTDPERDLAIQEEAERLVEKIANSGFPVNSEEYRVLWDASVAESDRHFRQRYGDMLWMAHHVQAHHLSAQRQADNP